MLSYRFTTCSPAQGRGDAVPPAGPIEFLQWCKVRKSLPCHQSPPVTLCIHAIVFQAASPAGPGSRLSLPGPNIPWFLFFNVFLHAPDLQVPSAELPRTEAQAEHAPARLHLRSLPSLMSHFKELSTYLTPQKPWRNGNIYRLGYNLVLCSFGHRPTIYIMAEINYSGLFLLPKFPNSTTLL